MTQTTIQKFVLSALNTLPKEDRDIRSISIFTNPNYEYFSKENEDMLFLLVEQVLKEFERANIVEKEKVIINQKTYELWSSIDEEI